MLEYLSSTEDLKRILGQLKTNVSGAEIVDEKIGQKERVLEGYVSCPDSKRSVHFQIKYNRDNFLRLGVEGGTYKEKLEALRRLAEGISQIDDNGALGLPIAFYNICEVNNTKPHLEWAFSEQEQYVKDLRNDTLFDDEDIDNLVLFQENEIPFAVKMQKIGTLMSLKCIKQ